MHGCLCERVAPAAGAARTHELSTKGSHMRRTIESTSAIHRPRARRRAAALGAIAAVTASVAFASAVTPALGQTLRPPYGICPDGTFDAGGICFPTRAPDFVKNQAKDPGGVAKSVVTTAAGAAGSSVCILVRSGAVPQQLYPECRFAFRSRAARVAKR